MLDMAKYPCQLAGMLALSRVVLLDDDSKFFFDSFVLDNMIDISRLDVVDGLEGECDLLISSNFGSVHKEVSAKFLWCLEEVFIEKIEFYGYEFFFSFNYSLNRENVVINCFKSKRNDCYEWVSSSYEERLSLFNLSDAQQYLYDRVLSKIMNAGFENGLIVDLGAGICGLTDYLRGFRLNVVPVDIVRSEKCNKMLNAPAECLSEIGSSSVSVVIFNHVLGHVFSLEHVLAEVTRISSGNCLIIIVHNNKYYIWLVDWYRAVQRVLFSKNKPLNRDPSLYRIFSRRKLMSAVCEKGFLYDDSFGYGNKLLGQYKYRVDFFIRSA